MDNNSQDLIKSLLKAVGVIAGIVIIAGMGKAIWINFGTKDKNVSNNQITTTQLEKTNKVPSPKKTYAYALITIEKPIVVSGGYDKTNPFTGMPEYESYCDFSYEKEYLVTENIREIENYSQRDKYDIIDQVRQDQNLKWRISAYTNNVQNDLHNCPYDDKQRFRNGDYKAKIEEIKVLTFDTYEKAWEDKESRR